MVRYNHFTKGGVIFTSIRSKEAKVVKTPIENARYGPERTVLTKMSALNTLIRQVKFSIQISIHIRVKTKNI